MPAAEVSRPRDLDVCYPILGDTVNESVEDLSRTRIYTSCAHTHYYSGGVRIYATAQYNLRLHPIPDGVDVSYAFHITYPPLVMNIY